jgi:hypothetical protein
MKIGLLYGNAPLQIGEMVEYHFDMTDLHLYYFLVTETYSFGSSVRKNPMQH